MYRSLRDTMIRRCVVLLLAVSALSAAGVASSAGAEALPGIAARTAGMRALQGLMPVYWDEAHGRLYLEVPAAGVEVLYVESLPYGVGSTDIGLDRGEASHGRVVRFERFGPKVLLVEPNLDFRSLSGDPAQETAVRQSFPESVLAGFRVEAEDPPAGGHPGAVLVDATSFYLRDAHGVGEALTGAHQEGFRFDADRSAIVPESLRDFPKNIEVETLLTFGNDAPGHAEHVRDVTPDAHALTVRQRQSFIALPGPGFEPRRFDARAGYFPRAFRDYTAPLGEPLDQQFIWRHRLVKKDPACIQKCEAQVPLQYYVDRGAPEPIRSALVEGGRWWDEAFQRAGWAPGTFRVDLLPEGADPLDVRYNMVQWVHRYTRGWSLGRVIADPRTGEIIKGTVTLGSLRARQDYLIAEALLAPYGAGTAPVPDPMQQMVLARVRQLSAHEIGHTLGLAHNFAASAVPHDPQQTMSVMDYPHPWVTLRPDGVPDLSSAYGTGIGPWDAVAIDYGYRQFPAGGDPTLALDGILRDASRAGFTFITDEDARPLGGAHPYAHLWDNGADPALELERLIPIRRAALARFGMNAIRVGTPVAQLADTLVPLYLLHRYQTEAAIKEIGGLDYRYQVRGDGLAGPVIVAPDAQRRALRAVLQTLTPEFLTLSEPLVALLPPRPPALEETRESFPSHTAPAFDPVAAAEAAADLTLAGLFNPQRAARLVEYNARDSRNPALLADVIDATLAVNASRRGAAGAPTLAVLVQHAVYVRTVEALLALAAEPQSSAEVRAIVMARLERLRAESASGSATDRYIAARIEAYQRSPGTFVRASRIEAPPGMPIGDDEE